MIPPVAPNLVGPTSVERSSVGPIDAALSPERLELREAAQAFEAIFVRRLLASARASSIADQTPFTGPGLQQFETMRDEQVAGLAAETGAFGLADQIERQLAAMIEQKELSNNAR
ncbi:rod-binding protein [Parerythrobacter jejuensis]|uniref:Flagellar protein FlgJ N-terminal domain-containing protein n=1 Tax=Parerythrobacter jejuensis TaxID=795812 RepID=A0A845AX60_9SPHN|nr:rod-binding protein [Parerythrobacter jejuensis]MXP30601.1 hypothetical protein [Parerythrobacter jejuensis]MXP33361.1 hypothetical protein [Parerythrobacter jejuensis]